MKFNSQRPQPHFQVFGLHFSAFSMFVIYGCGLVVVEEGHALADGEFFCLNLWKPYSFFPTFDFFKNMLLSALDSIC